MEHLTVQANGTRHSLRPHGRGPPLVLLLAGRSSG